MSKGRPVAMFALASAAVGALLASQVVPASAAQVVAEGDVAPASAAVASALDPTVAPGGNFDLSVWSLQLPIGSPGAPTTIQPAQLKGASGYTNPSYFWTDKNDGSMTFWDPEAGVTTPNSNYARTELREMNANGSAADWTLPGTHRLSARLRIVSVTKKVCVGQIHLGSGGTSTKPLLEIAHAVELRDRHRRRQDQPDHQQHHDELRDSVVLQRLPPVFQGW